MIEDVKLIIDQPLMQAFLQVFIVLFGALMGSFLNVCIYRLPRDRSLVRPRSACPSCERMILWYDNIPLLSFLLLKGKCRRCGAPISLRYPFIESFNAFLYWAAFRIFGLTPDLLVAMALSSTMIVVSFIDLDFQIIPNRITYPGIFLAVVFSFLVPSIHAYSEELTHTQGLVRGLIGAVLGYGLLSGVGLVSTLFYQKEAMGRGDFKLLTLLGALVGWRGVLWTLFLACLLGSLVGITLILSKRKGRKEYIPFGPFLAGAGLFVFFFSERLCWLWQAYFNGSWTEGTPL